MSVKAPPARYRILDISLPIGSQTACFPGDTPFSKKITLTYQETQVINLTAFTMSPHVGTHADAPIHIRGNLQTDSGFAQDLPLDAYLGSTYVIDRAPLQQAITLDLVKAELDALNEFPTRILFKTQKQTRPEIFEDAYAYFSPDLIAYLAQRKVRLVGIDTPSVDHITSKDLPVHHVLLQNNLCWLENVYLSEIQSGSYYLIALPLNFQELEASPVRAVLLQET